MVIVHSDKYYVNLTYGVSLRSIYPFWFMFP